MSNKKKSMRMKASLPHARQRSVWWAERDKQVLRFNPTAWAKLLYFRDKSDNEIGGFGITEPGDLLFVKEFVTVRQEVTCVSVKFDDAAVADFFDAQVDLGRKPEQFARIWLHSHPGDSPEPSAIDEATFERVFGKCQWAVLFVVAQDNRTYAKLQFNIGPGGHVLIPVEIDYSQDFGPSAHDLWDTEYVVHIKNTEWPDESKRTESLAAEYDLNSYALPYNFLDELEQMEPQERQFILDELANRPELWNEESEVMCL